MRPTLLLAALAAAASISAHAAPPAKPDLLIKGPMPTLASEPSAKSLDPAPMPNFDIDPPLPPIDKHPRVEPSMADRTGQPALTNGYAPGSGYSSQLERRTRQVGNPGGAIGTTLVPSLTVRVPLQYP